MKIFRAIAVKLDEDNDDFIKRNLQYALNSLHSGGLWFEYDETKAIATAEQEQATKAMKRVLLSGNPYTVKDFVTFVKALRRESDARLERAERMRKEHPDNSEFLTAVILTQHGVAQWLNDAERDFAFSLYRAMGEVEQ